MNSILLLQRAAILSVLIFSTFAEICYKDVCEFTFTLRKRQTMTYTAANGKTFNVAWNSTEGKLQIVGNSMKSKDKLAIIGEFLAGDKVITADGYSRNIIVINDQFPGPTIEVKEGAQVVVHVINELFTEGVVLHWHGMTMLNNMWMDGADYVTQCPVLPHQSFTYRFIADPAGTHWYHGHFSNQRLDGLYGALIVHDHPPPTMPYYVMIVQDWYHHDAETFQVMDPYSSYKGTGEASSSLDKVFITADGSELTSVTYVSSLINGRGRYNAAQKLPLTTFSVTSGQIYRFRVVNTGAEYAYEIMVDNHMLSIVASDGQPLKETKVDSFVLWVGESVDFYITANQPASSYSYWIRSIVYRVSTGLPLTHDGVDYGGLAVLSYGNQAGEPTTTKRQCSQNNQCTVFNCPFAGYADFMYKQCITFQDVYSTLHVNELDKHFGINDQNFEEIFLNVGFSIGSSINSRKFSFPKAPLVDDYEDYITRCDVNQCETGCVCTNIIDLPLNKTIQMIISNLSPYSVIDHHPMHIHGHHFAVMKVGFPEFNKTTGLWSKANSDVICDTDQYCAHPKWNNNKPAQLRTNQMVPVKDTLTVPARGYVVLRFKTNNPGYWMMHCHQQSHLHEGMTLLLNEGHGRHPPIPDDFPECGNFEWSSEDFMKYIKHQTSTAVPTTSMTTKPTTTTTQPPKTGGTTNPMCDMEELKNLINQRDSQYVPGSGVSGVTIETSTFIGAMVGFVLMGAVLGVIPMLLYICMVSRNQTKV